MKKEKKMDIVRMPILTESIHITGPEYKANFDSEFYKRKYRIIPF